MGTGFTLRCLTLIPRLFPSCGSASLKRETEEKGGTGSRRGRVLINCSPVPGSRSGCQLAWMAKGGRPSESRGMLQNGLGKGQEPGCSRAWQEKLINGFLGAVARGKICSNVSLCSCWSPGGKTDWWYWGLMGTPEPWERRDDPRWETSNSPDAASPGRGNGG